MEQMRGLAPKNSLKRRNSVLRHTFVVHPISSFPKYKKAVDLTDGKDADILVKVVVCLGGNFYYSETKLHLTLKILFTYIVLYIIIYT